ncbi:MAG: hypothetical protein IK084_02555, partial [Bacteroidaceae bacterium]|nr:hypothetical protein [Bacteroidaceae bacterium]
PSTTTSIGTNAFAGCTSLATVICRATTHPSIGTYFGYDGTFSNNASGRKIYVPSGTGATYKAASGWSTYANDIYELDQNGNIPT